MQPPSLSPIFTVPDDKKRKELKSELKTIEKDLAETAKGRANLMKSVKAGALEMDEIKGEIYQIRGDEFESNQRKAVILQQLDKIPTKEDMTRQSKLLKAHLKKHFRSSRHLDKMTFKKKQALLKGLFDGKDEHDKFYSIYLTKDSKGWTYSIYGGLDLQADTEGRLSKGVVKELST